MKITSNTINQEIYKDFEAVRYKKQNRTANKPVFVNKSSEDKFNLPVLLTTIAGTLASLLIIKKYQGNSLKNGFVKLNKPNDLKTNLTNIKNNLVNFLSIKPELKEVLIMGSGSILGGFAGGIAFDKNNKKIKKIKEFIYQTSNLIIPACSVAGLIKLIEKSKIKNPVIANTAKIGAIATGVGGGMFVSSKICNKINNLLIDKNSNHKRKMKMKDGLIHIDDVLMALVLAKVPFANKIGIDKILPFVYVFCGYEAAKQK